MPQRIVEEAQRGRWPHAAATRRARGGCGRRPRRTSSPMRRGIDSSALLVCGSQDPRARPTRRLGRAPRTASQPPTQILSVYEWIHGQQATEPLGSGQVCPFWWPHVSIDLDAATSPRATVPVADSPVIEGDIPEGSGGTLRKPRVKFPRNDYFASPGQLSHNIFSLTPDTVGCLRVVLIDEPGRTDARPVARDGFAAPAREVDKHRLASAQRACQGKLLRPGPILVHLQTQNIRPDEIVDYRDERLPKRRESAGAVPMKAWCIIRRQHTTGRMPARTTASRISRYACGSSYQLKVTDPPKSPSFTTYR